ncbi:molybdate ABC transporter substrate-binding protein [Variovorax sp. YR752]|uniref:molybdate ABC transporter substrate-binding protein n=1 Tax=Variovorax sp. YR752 TaxID=1884383 RepID=UPI003137EEB6
MKRTLLIAAMLAMGSAALAQEAGIKVLAAGSLRAALTDAARAFEAAAPGRKVELGFGASGLLKDRLVGGERADVFASANMEHPQALAAAGKAAAPQAFARNKLCALGVPGFEATPQTLVDRLLDPTIRVGTSTPKADPAGDYAFAMFERIEKSGRAGANKVLSDKALQLTGGPNSPPPPKDRNVYGALVAANAADVFLTYCTNVVIAQREQPALRRIEIPDVVNVSASYGVTVLIGAPEAATQFVQFLLSPAGQGVLAQHGFATP